MLIVEGVTKGEVHPGDRAGHHAIAPACRGKITIKTSHLSTTRQGRSFLLPSPWLAIAMAMWPNEAGQFEKGDELFWKMREHTKLVKVWGPRTLVCLDVVFWPEKEGQKGGSTVEEVSLAPKQGSKNASPSWTRFFGWVFEGETREKRKKVVTKKPVLGSMYQGFMLGT